MTFPTPKRSMHQLKLLWVVSSLLFIPVSALLPADSGLRTTDDHSSSVSRRQFFSTISVAFLPLQVLPAHAEERQTLTFTTLEDDVKVAEIRIGRSSATGVDYMVRPDSKVNIHITGRLLGKNGWIFENSQQEDDPYRLQLGVGKVVPGLEEGLVGMTVGGRRRIVVPSNRGYLDKSLDPIPRDFGNRQRLYTTVMNSVRIDRERSQLGRDLAGMVVFDVELLRIRN